MDRNLESKRERMERIVKVTHACARAPIPFGAAPHRTLHSLRQGSPHASALRTTQCPVPQRPYPNTSSSASVTPRPALGIPQHTSRPHAALRPNARSTPACLSALHLTHHPNARIWHSIPLSLRIRRFTSTSTRPARCSTHRTPHAQHSPNSSARLALNLVRRSTSPNAQALPTSTYATLQRPHSVSAQLSSDATHVSNVSTNIRVPSTSSSTRPTLDPIQRSRASL